MGSKLKSKPVTKWIGNDKFIIANGRVLVCGMRVHKEPVMITMSEYIQLRDNLSHVKTN